MQFIFKNTKYGRDPDTLLFARKDCIIQLNFVASREDEPVIHKLAVFDQPLTSQPEFFLMTEEQNIAIIATPTDGIYFNVTSGQWVDLDEEFDIGCIKEIIHDADARQIYFLANKYQGRSGVFLIKFHEDSPKSFDFFLKYKTNLDIADADIAVMKNKKTGFKELIISFKTTIENTYNVYIVDISGQSPWPLFRHESFQLWESQITAFFIAKTNDYVTINQDGISLISLDSFDKKYIKSADGQEKMIHAIESVNYLKVDPENFIHFDFSGHTKKIKIIQQFQKVTKNGEETAYEEIYALQVHDITLRELLFFQSLYVCPTQTDILNLVTTQDNPKIFFKTFLELDGTNMVSILSFDSRCISSLLDLDKNEEWFSPQYPLFYKNKIQKINNKEKFFFRSAIDMALETNQLTAAASIIKYIHNHQNNYVSSFLFTNNIIKLMERGVKLEDLFNSQVFNYTFDYDEWPSTHPVREYYSRAYNGNLFKIRNKYREIFPEDKFAEPNEDAAEENSKIFKISYKANILIQSGEYCEWGNVDPTKDKTFINKKLSFMDECYRSDELNLFNSEAIVDILNFKWKTFATKFHMIGCIMHFAYMFLLFNYINQIYINYNMENKNFMNVVLCAGLLYPCLYELYQIKRAKWEYFNDINNINDQLYVWCGLVNLISVQVTDTQAFQNKIIVTIILFQQILKTFFYLRIFATLSYIVTMIFQVVKDLRAFLIFFFILVVLYGLVFAVLGAGNQNQPGKFKEFYDECQELAGTEDECDGIPNEEYEFVGLFFGNMFYTLRTGIGDFDFGASYYLNKDENWTFFIIWFITVVVLCIIFLNFIIAEASASYQGVVDNLDALKNKEKAALISEAESMIPDKFKNPNILPKFIIIRQEDN